MTEGRLRFETAIFMRFFTSQGPGPMLTEDLYVNFTYKIRLQL